MFEAQVWRLRGRLGKKSEGQTEATPQAPAETASLAPTPELPEQIPIAPTPEPGRIIDVSSGETHVSLLDKIVEKEQITIERWAADHRVGRTTVFDWKALRQAGKPLKGKVSSEMSTAIEEAIEKHAKELGLQLGPITRTSSD
jgi:hypothetical protein